MVYKFMSKAVEQAKNASECGNVPVGAVIVRGSEIISAASNDKYATDHAEMKAIDKALKENNIKNLSGCDIYVTLEPCPMCAGAILLCGIKTVYFGAYDLKYGACCSNDNIFAKNKTISKVTVCGGICEDECKNLLTDFFKQRRKTEKH